MDLVSVMETIAATTAMAGEGKSRCSPAITKCHHGEQSISANNPSFYSCNQCHGQGSKVCTTCQGKQQLLVYINLTVTWCFFDTVYLLFFS